MEVYPPGRIVRPGATYLLEICFWKRFGGNYSTRVWNGICPGVTINRRDHRSFDGKGKDSRQSIIDGNINYAIDRVWGLYCPFLETGARFRGNYNVPRTRGHVVTQ